MDKIMVIDQYFAKKLLLSGEVLEQEGVLDEAFGAVAEVNSGLLIANKDNLSLLGGFSEEEVLKLDQLRVGLEKNAVVAPYTLFLQELKDKKDSGRYPLRVAASYNCVPKKYEITDFSRIFVSRYKFMEGLLRTRQELRGTLSINKVLNKKERDSVALIGVVVDINETWNGLLVIELEDLTGKIKVFVHKNKPEVYLQAQDLVCDEVVGVKGTSQNGKLYADTFVWPDLPITPEMKKYDEEAYVVFISDVHVGSTNFLPVEFGKFLDWLNGAVGSDEQKAIAAKVKYVFVAGDIVDGVGIYPRQDDELSIKDIYEQYVEVARLLRRIPQHIQVIVCPGNHDALFLSEPQPAFNPRYVEPLMEIPNVTLVSNPSWITIGEKKGFSGFDVLMYHGYSFDYYASNVDSIRNAGGYNRADLIMKFLLKRRHMAPSYGSTPYLPATEDNLMIKKIPDFFVSGHIHYSKVANYRNVTMICGSCWQSKTSFQEKVGHEPQPARVPVVNLQTREIKIMKFI